MEKIYFDPEISKIINDLNQKAREDAGEQLVELLRLAARRDASDLFLVSDVPPAMRIQGRLETCGDEILTPEKIKALVFSLLERHMKERFIHERAVDFAFEIRDLGRFRCNLHYQRKSVAASIRLFPGEIPEIETLNLPESMEKLVHMGSGLVLITGPSGCGKTTTVAALVHRINKTRCCHIITMEDPVEYSHGHIKSIVEQIEIGSDSPSFAASIKHAMRQSPEVIVVGEMRDLDTMSMAMTAAETGHLVFSTLHTHSTYQTVNRIIDVFPAAQQNQIRQQLSVSLLGIVTQQLIPMKNEKKRVPAVEVLFATPALRNLIRKGETPQIYSHIMAGLKDGMRTMEYSLAELVRSGKIDVEEARTRAHLKEEFEKMLG
jgi:twitching motility protein PilT